MQSSFVIPGDIVGSAEEFAPGEGTYFRGGYVYASTTGVTQIDSKNRSANVVPKANVPPKLNVGDVVVGRIIVLRESLAIVVLAFKRGYESRPIFNTEAVIHISHANNSYVKNIQQVFGLRDIVKAKIIDEGRSSIGLSTQDEDLGVVKAYCTKCAAALCLEKGRLVCQNCGHTETRKLSTDYGLGVIR
ncbi:MAG: exosome complex RNA-binding protein Csl4 [Methanotrichaceae archaeon]